ncbi:MAG: cytochrome c3 family protein [Desulfovibrio sp.]
MRKTCLMLAAAMLALLLSVSSGLAYKVPDEIVIKRPKGNEPRAIWIKEVKFPHGMHAVKNSCNSCHHKESDKTLGEFVPCTQCHKSTNPDDRNGFFRAWHTEAAPSCLGCHTVKRTKGGKNPVGCTTACHKP